MRVVFYDTERTAAEDPENFLTEMIFGSALLSAKSITFFNRLSTHHHVRNS